MAPTMMIFERFKAYRATVRIRREPDRRLPGVEQIDGKRLLFIATGEVLASEDPNHAGETKMVVWEEGPCPVEWLPSGDLIDIAVENQN
jgi:hypothetical protein